MRERKLIANNKKVRFEFHIQDTYEAGIVLTGTEIKSIRQGKINIKESYIKIRNGEAFVIGMHISPYEQGNIFNVDSLRERKLLLNKKEIRKLDEENKIKGRSILPLKVYINEKGLAKMEIVLGIGKKLHDKRESIAKRDSQRKIDRIVKQRYWYIIFWSS